MAKNYKENVSVNATGLLYEDGDKLFLNIEDVGIKSLNEILEKFKDDIVTITLKSVNELD